ncbi:MAG: hypothetical protein IJ974_03560 [Phascolarctobacterium sp.]|nr:hypothetical protein [Phascolarctobacterium sp.]MBR2140146.1 hypothetical protein [Phascolarctobacterium sp.]MBR2220042.1 hypothetical protein [Phascolarctobacterium sp.]
MEQELVITKAKYINDRAYIPLTVMATNQQQKYIDLLTSKDAEVANKEMAEKLLEEYLPSVEKILKALTSMEEDASAFNGELEKLYKSALRLTYILRVRFGTLLDFLAGEETDGAKVNALLGQTFYDFHNSVLEFNNLYALIVKGEGTYNLNSESIPLVQKGMTYWEISDVLRMPCSVNKGDTYYWTSEEGNFTLVVTFDEEGEASHVHVNE